MIKPVRLQLSRRARFRLQDASRAVNGLDAVSVARPSRWGNPFRIGGHFMLGDPDPKARLKMTWCEAQPQYADERFTKITDNETAVDFFRRLQEAAPKDLSALRGRNLACWCKPGQPCHADVLLEIANR